MHLQKFVDNIVEKNFLSFQNNFSKIFSSFQEKIIRFYSYSFLILNIKYSENHYTLTLKQKVNLAQIEVSDAKSTVIMKSA